MHILHITGSYGGTEVYKNLIVELDKKGIKQTVFVPLNSNNHNRIGQQLIDFSVEDSTIIYSTALKKYHRYLYVNRISTIVREIERNVDLKQIDLMHCATICSDAACAYELKKKYDIPYITAVRNTDLNSYYKILFWHRTYFSKIYKNASKVIFISPCHKKKYEEYYSKIGHQPGVVIPNGVDSLFLTKRNNQKRVKLNQIKLIFASAYVKTKNLKEIIQAVALLREEGYNLTLQAVGEGLPFRKENKSYIEEIKAMENLYPWLTLSRYVPKEVLKLMFAEADIYVMPSKPETFGLVYVEALSQGLPIIYAQGEGFDGYFENGYVGYAAKPYNIGSIASSIKLVIENYDAVTRNISYLNLYDKFGWDSVARQYIDIYTQII